MQYALFLYDEAKALRELARQERARRDQAAPRPEPAGQGAWQDAAEIEELAEVCEQLANEIEVHATAG